MQAAHSTAGRIRVVSSPASRKPRRRVVGGGLEDVDARFTAPEAGRTD
jgi:hypothetical protein